jgi:hypothetical protein
MPDSFKPTPEYVTKLLNDLRQDLRGLHERIDEVEKTRYLEDTIELPDDERKSGIEIRIGASAELIDNVFGAVTANPPRVRIEAQTSKDKAPENEAKREDFWNRFIDRNRFAISRFIDSTLANGVGFLKAARIDYPSKPRERLRKSNNTYAESEQEHVDRVTGLKRIWGPPIGLIDVHPLSAYHRMGIEHIVTEVVEHSWKSKPDVYRNYGIESASALRKMQLEGSSLLRPEVQETARHLRVQSGFPEQEIRPLPYSVDTSTRCLVTEYWSPDYHQIYVERRLIYEEENPHVKYFIGLGKVTSSPDPDKLAFGVAEIMRHNEPVVNRALTRIFEANELVGRRPAVEIPEGAPPEMETTAEGQSVARTYRFRTDIGVSLPPGAKVTDPFANVQHVYSSMPAIQLLLTVMAQHGTSPLFKGVPVASDSSGYRENSLYLMARSQLQDLIYGITLTLSDLIKWCEQEIVDLGETVYIDELSLSPSDIAHWPAKVSVKIEPMLPQNMIAEGTFWDRMWASRHVSRRIVRERGFNEQDPAALEWEVFLEDLRESLKPQLRLDILGFVLGSPGIGAMQGTELARNGGSPGDNQTLREGTGSMGREAGGYARAGQSREPPFEPGSFPPQ